MRIGCGGGGGGGGLFQGIEVEGWGGGGDDGSKEGRATRVGARRGSFGDWYASIVGVRGCGGGW